MSAKDLIDGVRRAAAIPLGLNRGRDVIARLIFDAPYSAALAAERDGKLNPPTLVAGRTESLASDHGPWVRQLAEVARARITGPASPFDFLSLTDLMALTRLSAKRDAEGFFFQEVTAVSQEPPAWVEGLSQQLAHQLAAVDPEAIIELTALIRLGSGEGGFARLLAHVRPLKGYGDPGAWLSGMPIHRYAARGLAKLGRPGREVLDHYPEMADWVVDPPIAEPVAEEASLEAIAQLERELEALVRKADLKEPFEFYSRSTYRTLDRLDDLDYFGGDEQMPYLTVGHAKREFAVLCICGDLEIGKAYFFSDDLEAAGKRLAHARSFVADLAKVIEEGPRIAMHSSAGGKAKARKLEPLKRAFIHLLDSQRPSGGWPSMERAARALYDQMLIANNALKTGPVLTESLESTLVTWLSKDAEVREGYLRNRRADAAG